VQSVLPPADSPAAEQQEALRRLATGLNGDVTLFDRDESTVAAIGRPLPPPGPKRAATMTHSDRGSISYVRLTDGRWLAASVPMGYGHRDSYSTSCWCCSRRRSVSAHFPIVRQITRRLERLQRGVESLGAGDLTHESQWRAAMKWRGWPQASNRAARQIEQLVQGHKALLANASHELRTRWPASDWRWS